MEKNSQGLVGVEGAIFLRYCQRVVGVEGTIFFEILPGGGGGAG